MKKIYSEQEFSYVVSSITGYTDQVGGELLAKALIGATTPKYASVRLGIKGTQALNLLDSNPTFQAGACSLDPAGTTTFTQRNITTCPETLFESLCYKDLYPTYQSMLMNAGQTSETVPFENVIGDLKVKQIQQRIETQLWNANTGATGTTSTCFQGLYYLIASGQTGVAVSASGTTFSPSADYGANGNPITEVDKLINALDDNAMVREDLVVFMSFANWRLYLQALTKANFFANYIGSSSITDSMEAVHPNTNVKVVPTIGLAGSNKITIGPKEYTVVGFDLTSDHEKLDMWYSKDFDQIRFRANYNYGVQIAKFGSTAYFATNGLA
jgi:hypothetical protein